MRRAPCCSRPGWPVRRSCPCRRRPVRVLDRLTETKCGKSRLGCRKAGRRRLSAWRSTAASSLRGVGLVVTGLAQSGIGSRHPATGWRSARPGRSGIEARVRGLKVQDARRPSKPGPATVARSTWRVRTSSRAAIGRGQWLVAPDLAVGQPEDRYRSAVARLGRQSDAPLDAGPRACRHGRRARTGQRCSEQGEASAGRAGRSPNSCWTAGLCVCRGDAVILRDQSAQTHDRRRRGSGPPRSAARPGDAAAPRSRPGAAPPEPCRSPGGATGDCWRRDRPHRLRPATGT